MLHDVELQTITLTPAASKAIADVVSERKLEGYALRVYMAGGGCCGGASFGMALDNNIREEDRTFESDGVRIVVDAVSLNSLMGAKIDFVNDPERGAGFIVESPMESPQAGGHEHSHGEESCACGGSCACNN
jgi:iron-sulfur cluster assembly accessory protein